MEIGDVINSKQDDGLVEGFKQFFARPENLATALVIATGLTGERRSGQSRVNKLFETGVAGLGFRGGLEQGVQQQRRQQEQDRQSAVRQAADISTQNAQVRQGAQRNELQQQQLEQDAQQFQTEQDRLSQPRPLNPSEIALNNAQAQHLTALASSKGSTSILPTLLEAELTRAQNFGTEPDLASVFGMAAKLDALIALNAEGRFDPISGTVDIPPEMATQLQGLGLAIPQEGTTQTQEQPQAQQPTQKQSLRGAGNVTAGRSSRGIPIAGDTQDAEREAVRLMRKQSEFRELDNNSILDRVEAARELANNRDALKKESIQQLRAMISTYSRVMSRDELSNVRKELSSRVSRDVFPAGKFGGVPDSFTTPSTQGGF